MFKTILLVSVFIVSIVFFSYLPDIAEEKLNDSINNAKNSINPIFYNKSHNMSKELVNGSKKIVMNTFDRSIKAATSHISHQANITIDKIANDSKSSIDKNLNLTTFYILNETNHVIWGNK